MTLRRTLALVAPGLLLMALTVSGCTDNSDGGGLTAPGADSGGSSDVGGDSGAAAPVFLVIDEDSIDNGNPPNDFSTPDVNDDRAEVGERRPLRWFASNHGREVDLHTGQVGDEAWFALKRIPDSWRSAGPTDNGTRNFVLAGPGLGRDESEDLLDEIPRVTPLRATALSMLVGETVFAIVYDSDVSINYSPLEGSLKGANLGIVALEVLAVTERRDGSTSDLPRVRVRVADAADLADAEFVLFANAPEPESSSEPFDIRPPAGPDQPEFEVAP